MSNGLSNFCHMNNWIYLVELDEVPPWRNRLARSAVNRKVGGSSPPGGDPFAWDLICLFTYIYSKTHLLLIILLLLIIFLFRLTFNQECLQTNSMQMSSQLDTSNHCLSGKMAHQDSHQFVLKAKQLFTSAKTFSIILIMLWKD